MSSKTFISPPHISGNRHNRAYVYDGISIEYISSRKGFGVRAKKSLKRGFSIPFGGVPIEDKELIKLQRRSGDPDHPADYIVINRYRSAFKKSANGFYKKVEWPVGWLNGNIAVYKELYPREPSGAWIGAMVNEASDGIAANAQLRTRRQSFTQYPNMPGSNVYICLTRDVPEGEEIVTEYGFSKTLYTRRLRYIPTRLTYSSNSNNCSSKSDELEDTYYDSRRNNGKLLQERMRSNGGKWKRGKRGINLRKEKQWEVVVSLNCTMK